MNIIETLAKEFSLKVSQVEATVGLIDDGNTIPFIARYRKEVTGSLDDTVLRNLDDRLKYLRNLEARKGEVSSLIEGQGKLTPEITEALNKAQTITEVEDIYRPYKPKRETRASLARKKGLEPLANLILEQKDSYSPSIEEVAKDFITTENEDKKLHAANTSLFTAKPKVFKYFTMKTAVARVFPSQKGWICQIPDANFAMCLIDSGTESAS